VLVGENPLEIDRLWHVMYRATYHYGRAGVALHVISAIDMALWDIAGKAAGRPVYDLLGGARLREVPVYASEVMPETADEVRAISEKAVADGYLALKLGWGPLGEDLDRDVELVAAARAALGPQRALMVDGGMAYTVKRAIDLVQRLDGIGIYWLEEPLAADDYDGYRRLSDAVSVRIAAGEADSGLPPYRALVEKGHVDVLQPDLARCGGFTVGRGIADLARERNVEAVPHCFSTGVLVAASLQFVAALERPTWSEYSVADSPFVSGLLAEPFAFSDGKLRIPVGPGLGVDLNEELLERMRVD
jgi:L-alanine-DL-glutamate epimerase-like enolase superfamily enzyme